MSIEFPDDFSIDANKITRVDGYEVQDEVEVDDATILSSKTEEFMCSAQASNYNSSK